MGDSWDHPGGLAGLNEIPSDGTRLQTRCSYLGMLGRTIGLLPGGFSCFPGLSFVLIGMLDSDGRRNIHFRRLAQP